MTIPPNSRAPTAFDSAWYNECQAAEQAYFDAILARGLDPHRFSIGHDDPAWANVQELNRRLDQADALLPPYVRGPLWWEGELRIEVLSIADLEAWVRHVLRRVQVALRVRPGKIPDDQYLFEEPVRLARATARNVDQYLILNRQKPTTTSAVFNDLSGAEAALLQVLQTLQAHDADKSHSSASESDDVTVVDRAVQSDEAQPPRHGGWRGLCFVDLKDRTEAERKVKNVLCLKDAERLAYLSWWAVNQMKGRTVKPGKKGMLKDETAYELLKNNEIGEMEEADALKKFFEIEGYRPPSYETWSRQLRAARSAIGEQKHSKGAGTTTGHSIIGQGARDLPRERK